jgi:hypothetical protein
MYSVIFFMTARMTHELWIACTPLGVNVFVTLATQ